MNVLFPLLTIGLFVIAGVCATIAVNHYRRIEAWRNSRNPVEL